jgi:hypothetical protein
MKGKVRQREARRRQTTSLHNELNTNQENGSPFANKRNVLQPTLRRRKPTLDGIYAVPHRNVIIFNWEKKFFFYYGAVCLVVGLVGVF